MTDERTRKQLTAAEFINIWKGGFIGVKEEDGLGYWEKRNGLNEHTAVFSFIEIEEDILIDGLNDYWHLHIIRSSLKNFTIRRSNIHDILIEETIVGSIEISNNSTVGEVKIIKESNSSYIDVLESTTGAISIKSSNSESINVWKSSIVSLSIINQSKVLDVQISESNTGAVHINKSTANSVEINDKSNVRLIRISNSSKTGDISITDSTIKSFIQLDRSVTGFFFISQQSITGDVSIKNSNTGYISLVDSIHKGLFEITSNSFVFGLKLAAKELRQVLLQSSYIQYFRWAQDSLCIFNANDCAIENLNFIRAIIPKDSVFQFNNCQISNVYFELLVNTSWLNISTVKPLKNHQRFCEIPHEHIEGLGALRDESTKEFLFESGRSKQVTTLNFIASDFGKTSFVDCRLDQFDKFIFYNTKLLEVFVAGTPLPKHISLPKGKTGSPYQHEQNEQERLAFGQFKRIYENRGDTVSATDYLALEMNAYYRYLKQPEVIRERGGTKAERFTIWLNKISNNHGTDWLRAVGVTLGINGIMFAIYCYFLGYEPYVPFYSKIDWHTTLNLFSYSLEFLNPLRKADFLDKVNLEPVRDSWDWVARFWDYISRIVVAYFVYQTVQAFRRYGKTK